MSRPPLPSPPLALLMAGVLLIGCETTESFAPSPCDVSLEALEPKQALAGQQVSATGGPFTSAYDTAVYVGSARATLTGLTRDGCDACDDCLLDQDCTGCDDCDACDPLCSECLESVAFVVPATQAGETVVRLLNRHGESNALPFEVLASPGDTGQQDTGQPDSDPTDSGAGDTGPVDTGPGDSAPTHTGSTEDTVETADPSDTDSAPVIQPE